MKYLSDECRDCEEYKEGLCTDHDCPIWQDFNEVAKEMMEEEDD